MSLHVVSYQLWDMTMCTVSLKRHVSALYLTYEDVSKCKFSHRRTCMYATFHIRNHVRDHWFDPREGLRCMFNVKKDTTLHDVLTYKVIPGQWCVSLTGHDLVSQNVVQSCVFFHIEHASQSFALVKPMTSDVISYVKSCIHTRPPMWKFALGDVLVSQI